MSFSAASFLVSSQSNSHYYIYEHDGHLIDSLQCESCDSITLNQALTNYIDQWRQRGFLTAGVDSIRCGSSGCKVFIYRGPLCNYASMRLDSNSERALRPWYKADLPAGNGFATVSKWLVFFRNVIDQCSQNGYPFAAFHIKKLYIDGDSLVAELSFSTGPLIKYRKIEQRQKEFFSERFLQLYLGITAGRLYDHQNIAKVDKKLSKLGYVQSKYPPRVLFLGNETLLWLYLEKRNSNRFDFLLGLIPSAAPAVRKYRLSGEANFEMYNALKVGDQFKFRYENMVENSPRLQIQFEFPFMFGFPLGLASDFKLQRFRERFIELQSKAWLNYALSSSQRLGVSVEYNGLTMLQPDTQTVIRTGRLPRELDVQFTSWGLSYLLDLLDQRLVPTRGTWAKIELQLGSKSFRPNNTLLAYSTDAYPLQRQYDSLNDNSQQLKVDLSVQHYWRLGKRHVIRLADQFQFLYSRTFIASNEFFRFGGYKTVRGFDENFFISPIWNGFTLEYRFLLDPSSFLHVFSDVAQLRQQNADLTEWRIYHSIGTGIQFTTKVGSFGLQYAMGRRSDTGFDLSSGKIHFGYTSLF